MRWLLGMGLVALLGAGPAAAGSPAPKAARDAAAKAAKAKSRADGGTASKSGAKATTHEVNIEGLRFSPAELEVQAGDTVVWTNKDIVVHTATAEDGSFDSGSIEHGKSWSHRMEKAGTVDYKCTFHPTMKGTLTVH